MLTDFDFFRFQVLASAMVSVENGLPYKLKEKQKCALATLGNGGHVFLCLPTGYGKSECFSLLPSIRDLVNLKNANGFWFLSISSTCVSYGFCGKWAFLPTKGEAEVCISNLGERGQVFLCLPTGYGKSECFSLLPSIRDLVNLKNANGFRFLSISSNWVSYRFCGKRGSLQTKG